MATELLLPNPAKDDVPRAMTSAAVGVTSSAAVGVSPADLADVTEAAVLAYVSSRENIARATATVCFIDYHACSEHASPDNRAWFEELTARCKAEIEAHNRRIQDEKEAEKQRLKDDLQELKKTRRGANDPDRQKALDTEIAARRDASAALIRNLDAQRKVKLEARDGAAEYTGLTKLILRLHGPKQASQVHRVAKCVKGLKTEWGPDRLPDIPAMTQLILDQGGFEALYERQLGREGKAAPTTATDANDAPNGRTDTELQDAVAEHFRSIVASAHPIDLFPHIDKHAEGGLVALIGRVGPDGIAVLGGVGMDHDEVLSLCVAKHESRLLPGDPGSEFAAVTLSLGQLVEEGKRTIKGSGKVDVTRQLSMVVDDADRRLVVSAENADSCIVVHAEPKAGADGLLPIPGYRRLRADDVKVLAERLADDAVRKMFTLRGTTEPREVGDDMLPSDLTWTSTSGPLVAKGDPAASIHHPWLAMSPAAKQPLDVDRFHPVGSVTLPRSAAVTLARGKIGNWKAEKADSEVAEKKAALARISFAKSTVAAGATQEEDTVTGTGHVRGRVVLHFRPRVIARVLDALVRLNAGPLELSPDDRGALRLSFEDANGRYSVFVPACDEDGAPLTAVFHPMRVRSKDED